MVALSAPVVAGAVGWLEVVEFVASSAHFGDDVVGGVGTGASAEGAVGGAGEDDGAVAFVEVAIAAQCRLLRSRRRAVRRRLLGRSFCLFLHRLDKVLGRHVSY